MANEVKSSFFSGLFGCGCDNNWILWIIIAIVVISLLSNNNNNCCDSNCGCGCGC